jgi:hypothetical protein
MRTVKLLILLNFLTIPLALDFYRTANGSTQLPTPVRSYQMVAAKTRIGRNPPPDKGTGRREFNYFRQIGLPRL